VIGWRDQLAFLSMTFPSSGDMGTSGQGPGRAYYDRDSQRFPPAVSLPNYWPAAVGGPSPI
jgi:hypothetical protein